MRKCAPILAASLAACGAVSPHPQGASRPQFEADVKAYIAANWGSYVERMQRMNGWPTGPLELMDIADLQCTPSGGAVTCDFQLGARSAAGDLVSGKAWGSFAYDDGRIDEVIIVG